MIRYWNAVLGVMTIFLSMRGEAWADTPAVVGPTTGALARYVAEADAAYAWRVRRRGDYGVGQYAELILTSQRWHDVVWKHQVFVYKPAEVRDATRAVLLIGGGAWRDALEQPPTEGEKLPGEAAIIAALADKLGSPVAVVLQVPHQPIFGELREDAAISYTFEQFFRTGDDSWPLLLPMVKSAVRAMDCVGEFGEREWNAKPTKFTLTGASKRGWTTWLTAAVDDRVVCLAPMVIDMLNLSAHMKLQVESWGGFSEQIHDYTERGLQRFIDAPPGKKLLEIVDPYSYRAELTQPKLVVLGTNDRYWPLDSLNLYWNSLEGEKYVCYVPNNGHGLRDFPRIVGGVCALHRHAAGELKLPKLSWEFIDAADHVDLVIRSDRPPHEVNIWQAASATRDFRDREWKPTLCEAHDGEFRYRFSKPAGGYAAFFGEAMYDDPLMPYYFSTNVRIIGAK